MKRFFTKKSVALFLLSIIACGFFYFGIANQTKAQTANGSYAPNTPQTTNTNTGNPTYTYNGIPYVYEGSDQCAPDGKREGAGFL